MSDINTVNVVNVQGDVRLARSGGGGASWGSITGDIDNQTDLIEKFTDYVTEEDFDRVKYVHVEGEDYPIIGMFTATEGGISGINIHLNDGTVDGKTIFLPDGMGVTTASDIIIAMIPTNVSQLNNDSGYITGVSWGQVTGKPNFATVATSGSYNDLSNKPTIPTVPTNISAFVNDSGYITSVPVDSVNGKTGTVVLNASDVGALASNTTYVSTVNGSSGAVTISVPTKTSDLQNDSGFLTSAVTTFNGQSGAVTYSAPVSSVNGRTGAVTGLQNEITVQNMTASSATLSTGIFYVWGEIGSLSITVTATGMYAFRFESGSTATSLTITGATMPDDFTVEANKTYEINIYQGYGVVSSWS